MSGKRGLTGIILALTGFILAVPLAYAVIVASDETFIKILKLLTLIIFVIIGSLLTATGIIILSGWPKREEEVE